MRMALPLASVKEGRVAMAMAELMLVAMVATVVAAAVEAAAEAVVAAAMAMAAVVVVFQLAAARMSWLETAVVVEALRQWPMAAG